MGQKMHRAVLRAALLASAAAVVMTGKAWAEDATAEGVGLEEVVVTAQKRATNLQATPIAISAIDDEALKARHVQSLEDLGDGAIPSLRVAPFFARKSALTIGMRGVGSSGDANQPARDQAVGVYINGVYLGRAQGLGSALYDVERIEVLKGPQGTLFGRNTEGGAISIVTKAPSGVFGMSTTLGVGNYNSYKAESHIDLPEFHDVSIKIDALLSKRDGTTTNPTSSGQPDFNAYDKRGVQIEALWQPTDDLKVDYAYDNSYDASTPFLVQLLKAGPYPLAPLAPTQPDRAEAANIGVPMRPSEGFTRGHRLNLNWTANDSLELKSISSYRKLKQGQYDNAEAVLGIFSPNAPFARYSIANTRQDQFSQEVQAIGSLPQIDYVLGAFYFRENVSDNAQTPNTLQWDATGAGYSFLSVNLNAVPFDRVSHVETTSYGVFGQAVWTPTFLDERAHLTVGGRFTKDKKQGALDIVNGALPTYVDASKTTITGIIPLDASWSHFDPLVTLAYDAADNVHLYGRWSTGYKAGGANSRSLTYRPFDPEEVSMYEIGAKTEFWDRRARLNLAAYSGELTDAQVDFNVLILNNNRGTLETTNAATGKTKGFEADLTVMPVEGLTLSAGYTYTRTTLSQAFNPFTNSMSKIYPIFTPENAASLAVDYERPAFGAILRAHLDGAYADGQYTSTTDPTLSDDSLIVNGRLALTDIQVGDGPAIQVAVWSRNLLDESHAFLRNTNASLGVYGIYNEPRTYGVELNVRF